MSLAFEFTRLENGRKSKPMGLAAALGSADPSKEIWLFVSPHDDDIPIGSGLLVQAAVQAGAAVHSLIVTDGRMGYCALDQKDRIVEIRQAESYESYGILGVPKQNLHFLGFPDGELGVYEGRRAARGDEPQIQGFTGLQNSFTYHLRRLRPSRLLVPSPADLHPDHQSTHRALMISIFHAAGTIWPELGKPMTDIPAVYELAVYCDFSQPPQLQLHTDDQVFEKKLRCIDAYRSQTQISLTVDKIRASGPFEYIREHEFRLYSPQHYKALFGEA